MSITTIDAVKEFIPLFNILSQTDDEDKIHDTCLEISVLFEKYSVVRPPLIIADEMIPFIKGGLQHPYHQVRQLTMKQLQSNITRYPDQLVEWLSKNNILSILAPMLASSRLRIANTTLELFALLSKLSLNNNNIKQLLKDQSLYQSLLQVFNENKSQLKQDNSMDIDKKEGEEEDSSTYKLDQYRKDEVILRVLDVAVLMAITSREALELYKNPFLEYLLNRVPKETDTLVKVNLLEIISKLGNSSLDALSTVSTISPSFIGDLIHSLNVENIKNETDGVDSHSINSIIVLISRWCLGGDAHVNVVMKSVSSDGTQLESAYFGALEYFLSSYRENEVAKRCLETSIGAIGDIGSLESGLNRIVSRRSLMKEYMETITSADPISMCTMHSFATMLIMGIDKVGGSKVATVSTTVSDKLLQVYNSLGAESSSIIIRRIMKSLSSPIEDIKSAALHLAQGLCFHSWGAVSLLTNSAGFMEYLISRTNENTKVMREWKFTIVQTLVTYQQPVLDNPTYHTQWNQLQTYYRKGVHYIPAEANLEVATHHQ